MTGYSTRAGGFLPLALAAYRPPECWRGTQAMLVPAGPEWVTLDYAAVMASRRHIQHLFGPADSWPAETMRLEEDRADLIWHEQEFLAQRSFAYHLLTHDYSDCLGCLYLYPTASQDHDAEAYLWTHATLPADEASRIEDEVVAWVARDWPFRAVAWPGRFIAFDAWAEAGIPNYYASTRMVAFLSASGA